VTDPHADCQTLLNSVLPFAYQMLTQHGAFYPFGGAMQPDGKIAAVGADIGTERPDAREMAGFLKGAFTAAAKKGEYKATALVTDTTFTYSSTGKKTDAISVSLDHRDNYSMVVIIPYRLDAGKLIAETAIAQKGAGDVFPAN
jgi:hypothetical protein